MALRVLHLVGSAESEFLADLSCLYAADCLATVADEERYTPVIAYVSPGGGWRFPDGLGAAELAAAPVHRVGSAVRILAGLGLDIAVPQMFCRAGMTTYRALLDLLEIPFVGNRAEVMAIGADKQQSKALVAAAGVDTPASRVLERGEAPDFPVPAVVKPLDSDNSFGVSLVRAPEERAGALAAAREHADRILVEDYVAPGREVRCGVLEVEGGLLPLPLEEYDVDAERPIRRIEDKIARAESGELALVAKGGPRVRIVADHDPLSETVWEVARRCHRALGCRHYSLFDFRVDADGRPWFLEAGLYCSFARQSVIATMAAAAGIETRELFDGAVRDALADRIGGSVR